MHTPFREQHAQHQAAKAKKKQKQKIFLGRGGGWGLLLVDFRFLFVLLFFALGRSVVFHHDKPRDTILYPHTVTFFF
jgi:hypothetical protein